MVKYAGAKYRVFWRLSFVFLDYQDLYQHMLNQHKCLLLLTQSLSSR